MFAVVWEKPYSNKISLTMKCHGSGAPCSRKLWIVGIFMHSAGVRNALESNGLWRTKLWAQELQVSVEWGRQDMGFRAEGMSLNCSGMVSL